MECEQCFNSNPEGWLKLLSSEQIRLLEAHLDASVTELLKARGVESLSRLLRLYVMRPGKRVRPQLVAWTFLSGSSEQNLPRQVCDVAAAWEIFHAFLLIHDDIIDGSDLRRREPALHRQLESLDSDSPRFGMNLGIVAGDLMYAATMRLLADLDDATDAEYRALHKVFAHVAQLTGFGQAIDVIQSHSPIDRCDEATLLREYHWKTAAYTFEGPMRCGAILAGLSNKAQEAISAFALAIGQAYQLQNDLLDLSAPVTEGSDMAEGKRTITLLRARQSMGLTSRDAFDADLSRVQASDGRAMTLAESLRQQVIHSGAIAQTQQTISALLAQAESAALSDALPAAVSASLKTLLSTLSAGYFTVPHDLAEIVQ